MSGGGKFLDIYKETKNFITYDKKIRYETIRIDRIFHMTKIFLCSQFIFKSIISLVIISKSIIFSKNITFSKDIMRKEQKTALIFQRFYIGGVNY